MIKRIGVIGLLLFTYVAAPLEAKEPRQDAVLSKKVDVVISKDQLLRWLAEKERCGAVEGKKCRDAFRRILEFHQRVVLDHRYEQKTGISLDSSDEEKEE